MARGWESKDLETQAEATEENRPASKGQPQPPEKVLREQELRGLRLSRIRILNDLQLASHPNHRQSLEAALAYLDRKIADLENH